MYKGSSYDKNYFIEAAQTRWEDAKSLLTSEAPRYEGACYLGGYAVEMLLKYIIYTRRGCQRFNDYAELTPQEIANFQNGQTIRYGKVEYNLTELSKLFSKLSFDLKNNIQIHDLKSLIKYLDTELDTNIGYATFEMRYDKLVQWSEKWRYQIEKDHFRVVIDQTFAKSFFCQINDFFDEMSNLGLITDVIRARFVKYTV